MHRATVGTEGGAPLKKTCQACFGAKIRCTRTQDSSVCDRCLRLGKKCLFHPSRRHVVRHARRERPEPAGVTVETTLSPLPSVAPAAASCSASPGVDIPLQRDPTPPSSHDPFHRGLLSLEAGQGLLDYYVTKMSVHMPFVILPRPLPSPTDLMRDRPCVCIAALAAAAHKQPVLQASLGKLFNELVAYRLTAGPFHTLDLLQGLLIHVAWAHFQPRPRRHMQHLQLANSIICDMRLDRFKKPIVWHVDGIRDRAVPDSGPEKKRALAGAYYLSSSSSILLDKAQHFVFTPYVTKASKDLACEPEVPSDSHIQYIIRLQRLIEEVSSIATRGSEASLPAEDVATSFTRIMQEGETIKSTLPFPLSDSPLVAMQMNLLELMLSQSTPTGGAFGMDRFPEATTGSDTQPPTSTGSSLALVDWLSASMSAARSLFSAILTLPSGEEGAVSNVEWIAMQCALSLAVRLDLFATYGRASETTRHLSRFLDIRHTLRHAVMRLESVVNRNADSAGQAGNKDGFRHLAHQARRLESWYLAQSDRAKRLSVPAGIQSARGNGENRAAQDMPDAGSHSSAYAVPDTGAFMTGISPSTSDDTWMGVDLAWDGRDSQMASMGDFLFADLLNFPPVFEDSQA